MSESEAAEYLAALADRYLRKARFYEQTGAIVPSSDKPRTSVFIARCLWPMRLRSGEQGDA